MNESAPHGGAFFTAIGENFRTLGRSESVISADVLDAWFDPAPAVLERLREYLPFLARTSPPLRATGLVEAIAEARGLHPDSILAGAGSSALLFACLPRLTAADQTAVRLDPTYGEYEHCLRNVIGARVAPYALEPARNFLPDGAALAQHCRETSARAVVLVNPNNPTGRLWPRREVEAFLAALPGHTIVLVDETYIEFASEQDSAERLAAAAGNLLVLKSMSKVYALSGLRVGYLVGHPRRIRDIARYVPPWPVSLPGQVAAVEALRATSYYRARWRETRELRETQRERLGALPSDTNWLLVEVRDPRGVAGRLRDRGIFVRDFDGGGYFGERCLRIAVKDEMGNRRIAEALRDAL